MNLNYAQGEYPFPDEFAPPRKKAKNDYGLQSIKAMFYSKNRQGFSIFSRESLNYNALQELAQGRQSTDNIRRLFGFYSDQGSTNQNDKMLAYVDVQVINFATKYVNRTVAKLQKFKYKIGLSAADPISVEQAKEYDAKIKTYYELKDYWEAMGQKAQDFLEDVNVDILPKYPEEIMFQLNPNQKIQKIIDGEKTLELVNNVINDFSQVMRQYDWDSVVIGHGHIHCFLDENFMPRMEWVNPKYWFGSYVQNEDHKKQEYSGFVNFITVNQFKKEAEGKLTQDEIDSVLRSHAWPNTATTWNTLPDQMINYDGLRYIPVARFYFLSNDHTATAFWQNDDGNLMRDERDYRYQPSATKKRKEEVIKNEYTTVYGGSWVVDSEIVYNYGPKDIPRSNLVNARLPIISFAPNMKEGRYVSLLSQMIEPLTMINVCWNKVKDILAKGRNGILNINLTAFENLALGKGGESWSAKEAIDFLFQTNVGINRQQTNPYGTAMGENISFQETGVTIADYFTTMQTCIQFLNELSGATLAETTDIPDRLTSKTMMANVAAGSDSIEYLVNGHVQVYHQTAHMMLLLTQEAKRHGIVIKGLIPSIGRRSAMEMFEAPDELPYCDYGLSLQREATPEEWAQFYQDIAEGIAKGLLNASDSAFLREIPDMTMARFALATREQINEKKAADMRAQEQQFQMQSAEQAAAQKMQMEAALLDQEHKNAMELAALQGQIDEALLEKEAMAKAELQGISNMVQERINKQKGIDTIVKEAMRSRAEAHKANRQFEGKLVAANTQAKTGIATSLIAAQTKKETEKNKPKPAKK